MTFRMFLADWTHWDLYVMAYLVGAQPPTNCSFARHLGSGKWSSRLLMTAHHDLHSPVIIIPKLTVYVRQESRVLVKNQGFWSRIKGFGHCSIAVLKTLDLKNPEKPRMWCYRHHLKLDCPLPPASFLGFVGINTWNPKQPVFNGCLVKQPFPM